jgi:uncharacterized protein YuzE
MTRLAQALPELVADMENALAHLGRGDLIGQMKQAILERWTYDEFSDTTYLYLKLPSGAGAPEKRVVDALREERLSLYDEVGVNLDTDRSGRLCGIEVLDGKRVTARLGPPAA